MFEETLRDIRFTFRSLVKTPAFTAIILITLGLGIGANTAIFSVVSSVLLKPLPYSDSEGIVMVWNRWKDWDKTWLSIPEYLDYRELSTTLDETGIWAMTATNLTGDGEPERVVMAAATPGVFDVLGVEAGFGRVFTDEEGLPGRDDVAVISNGLWQRRFGGETSIVGEQIELDGQKRTILGVMPAGFKLPLDFRGQRTTDLWVPLAIDRATVDRSERGNHSFYSVARLARGATIEQANAELEALTSRFTEEGLYHVDMGFETFALPVTEEIVGEVRPALLLLLAAVGFLLLIACSNVANLLLTKAEGRHRELAIRTAIGAGRGRVIRQLVTESIVLSLLGGIVGLGIAYTGSQVLVAWNPENIPRVTEVSLSSPVLVFTIGVSVLTGLLFGLIPALQMSRLELTPSLKEGSQATTAGAGRPVFRSAVTILALALAVVLVIGAGLMARSFWELLHVDTGFRPDNVLTTRLSLPTASYPEPENMVSFYERLLERVDGLAGVEHVGMARSLPLDGTMGDWNILIEGRPPTPGSNPKGDWQVVSPGYFEAMGMRLGKGRFFKRSDRTDAQPVAVINETMATRYWPEEEPLGKRFQMGTRGGRPWITIVGVVGDVVHNGLDLEIKEKLYLPHAQFHRSTNFAPRAMALVVRTESNPMALVPALRRQVHALDANLPLADIRSMDEVLTASVSEPRFTTFLLGGFAVLALLLASVGIYGVISYIVSRRIHEIGIRVALGAGRGQVLGLFMRQGLALSVIGLLAGLGIAFGVTRLMSSLLYGVGTLDLATFTLVPIALLLVALGASFVPAFRATRVDPITALRME